MSVSPGHLWRVKLLREFGVSAPAGASIEDLRGAYERQVAARDIRQAVAEPVIEPVADAVPPGPRRPRVAGKQTVPAAEILAQLEEVAGRIDVDTGERRRLVRAAVAAGAPVRLVAAAAGLSKSEVARMAPRRLAHGSDEAYGAGSGSEPDEGGT